MKKRYLRRIFEILAGINDMWVLEQIYRCAVHMTEEGKEVRLFMFIPEFVVGMIAGFALGISALVIAAIIYSKKSK